MDIWKLIIDMSQVATAIAAFVAVFMTWRGWKEASKTARDQAIQESIMSTNYDIYKDILSQVNSIIEKNSSYTTGLRFHIDRTAELLNEWHGLGGFQGKTASGERKRELVKEWAESTKSILDNSHKLLANALDLTRMLDMSGADFGSNSKAYNALWLVYHDLNNSMQKIQNKWTKIEIEDITILQYDWLKDDTYDNIERAEEFGECVDDVLKLVYNNLIAKPMKKTLKELDSRDRRRMITLDGLKDNRLDNAS